MYKYNNIIKKLYNGEIKPCEEENHINEYEKLMNESIEISEQILDRLDKETTDIFFQYINLQSKLMNIEAEEQFTRGFKIATRLIIEGNGQ